MPTFVHFSVACNLDENSSRPPTGKRNGTLDQDADDLEASEEESTDAACLRKSDDTSARPRSIAKTSEFVRRIGDCINWLGTLEWRSLTHSFKAGLALGVVSCLVLLEKVYARLGKNATWAVLTVVVVFESTVGATLTKGLNRGLGTFVAASVALLFDYMTHNLERSIQPYFLGGSIFFVGMATTYGRFFKVIKARFDYSMVVFSLTFCLVSVAGYRGSDNVKVALDRMLIVLLGCMVCIVVSLFVFPVWAGDDLHNLIVNNFDDLAESIEGCTAAYFHSYDKKAHVQTSANDTISKGYMAVLLSKQTEENLVKQARFEPWHGRFGCMYPWQKCIQVGTILRNCAYIVCALHGCVLSEIQAPENLKDAFSQPCIHISSEVARVLREIAIGLRSCCKSQRSKQSMLHSLHLSVLRLHTALGAYNNQIAHIYNMTSSVVNSHKNGDVEVHINAACDVSAATLSTGGSAIPGTRIHQPHQFKRLFSNSLLHLPYCSSDIYHSHSASIDVIADKNLLKQCQEFTECFSVTTVAALLIEIVSRLEPLLKAVAELEEQACFKDVDEPVSSWIRRPNLKHLKTEKIVMQHGMAQIHAM